MFGNDLTIYETVKGSPTVFPHTANPAFALIDLAPMVAKIAAYPSIAKGFIQHGFFHNITRDPV